MTAVPPGVGVIYLARAADGQEAFARFAASYAAYPAGAEHELVVLYKGFDGGGGLDQARAAFGGLPHRGIELPDTGFDIGSYAMAADQSEHGSLCFLNTHTEIAAPDWLAHMLAHFGAEGVGLVGSTGSYESLRNTVELLERAIGYALQPGAQPTPAMLRYFDFVLSRFRPEWFGGTAQVPPAQPGWLGRALAVAQRGERPKRGTALIWDGAPEIDTSAVPRFPNPHVRSNGFLVGRAQFLAACPAAMATKADASQFESGRDSLTAQVRRAGLQAVIVGCDGARYDVWDWSRSRTFRLGGQDNLLFADNHTRGFAAMSRGARVLQTRMSWGDYLGPAPADLPDFGVEFPRAAEPPAGAVRSQPRQRWARPFRPAAERERPMPLKISFLIPSKNRLDLLKLAIASIREQPGLNYEIVVADNHSSEDYGAYIAELADPRIVFKRQDAPVSVTQNWQDSLALATGDYILMLGDDDALAPNFAEEVGRLLAQDGPDLLYVASYHYCYPDVIPGMPLGYLASVLNSEFLHKGCAPFYLDRAYAAELARSILDFRHRFGLNAQHYVVKASLAARFAESGGLYQSPYPDTYSSVALFLHAERILVVAEELVIIGISPKSFGAYYFSGRHDAGYVFLDNVGVTPEIRDSLQPVILPGDRNDTNWLIAAEAVRQAFPTQLGERVNVERYRTLQMVAVLRSAAGAPDNAAVEDLRGRLSPSEAMTFRALEAAVQAAAAEGPEAVQRSFAAISQSLGQYHPAKVAFVDIGVHATVADAIAFLRRPRPAKPLPVPSIVTVRAAAAATAQDSSHATEAETSMPDISALLACVRPWLCIYRDGQVFSAPMEDMDRFPFQTGDVLSVEPSTLSSRWHRTPDGDIHVPVAPGVGVRVPPVMRLVEFKGFTIPEHLVEMTGAGISSFDALGRAHMDNYRRVTRLHPDMTFLEIGSGAGRDAFQLIDILGPSGRYYGIDVQRESIAWCQNNITRKHPHITFHHFNAEHELHNPLATKTTLDFRLPAPDGTVDFVALGSVFTHIFEAEVGYYLKEIARVLKPDGLCYATFFLYKDEVIAASRRNNITRNNLRFDHAHGDGCYVNDATYPTGAVAFTEPKMEEMIRNSGLTLAQPYIKGLWSGYYPPEEAGDGQDVAVLRRA